MNCKEIIKEWLNDNDHSYDGLCNPDIDCRCWIADVMPCIVLGVEPNVIECVAGHKELQDDGDWLLFPGKKEA